ncbi:MAG: hypothetical protein IPK32_12515 [Verrucomicrobiaceae bacterium]|nr:hypothetical protein [Verrucomicrobiaceae bacterium]
MAANPTPTNPSELLAALMDMARACAAHGDAMGLKINTGPVMEAAVKQAQDTQAEAGRWKAERGAARRTFLEADAESKRTLGRCRLRLVMFYGPTFNVNWDAAGFPDSSTQVPESQDKRAGLLTRLAGWFGAKPELESADMQATAAACAAAHEALRAARREVLRTEIGLAAAVQAKDEALEHLRTRYRSVISELHVLLAEDDARWRLFGLNEPAKLTAPDPVPAAKAENCPPEPGCSPGNAPAMPAATACRCGDRVPTPGSICKPFTAWRSSCRTSPPTFPPQHSKSPPPTTPARPPPARSRWSECGFASMPL